MADYTCWMGVSRLGVMFLDILHKVKVLASLTPRFSVFRLFVLFQLCLVHAADATSRAVGMVQRSAVVLAQRLQCLKRLVLLAREAGATIDFWVAQV